MDIAENSEVIKDLYRTPGATAKDWDEAIDRFHRSLAVTEEPAVLVDCILRDENWELSVDERLAMLRKARRLGAASDPFLKDYFGYLAAHLDPSPEQAEAVVRLDALMSKKDGS